MTTNRWRIDNDDERERRQQDFLLMSHCHRDVWCQPGLTETRERREDETPRDIACLLRRLHSVTVQTPSLPG